MAIFSINSGSFGDVQVAGLVSASTLKADGSQITNVAYANIANKPTLISSSAQVDITSTTGYSTFSSSISTVDAEQNSRLASVESTTGSYATTGSNTFKASQTISGSLTITQNLTVLGSSSIQYISQSTLNIGTNIITVNTQTPSINLGGLSVIDSGSSPQRSGSLLFDSLNDQWVFVHQNTAGGVTSSVLVMGPPTFNNVGNETLLTQNQLIKGNGLEHVTASIIYDDGTRIGVGTSSPQAKLHVVTGSVANAHYNNQGAFLFEATEAQMQLISDDSGNHASKFVLTNASSSTVNKHWMLDQKGPGLSNRFDISYFTSSNSGNIFAPSGVEKVTITTDGNVGIGTTSPGVLLDITGLTPTARVVGTAGTTPRLTLSSAGVTAWSFRTSGSDSSFRLDQDGTDRITVLSGGNVGIGTTNPGSYKLDIAGITRVAGSYLSINDVGYLRGDSAGVLVIQGGSTSTVFNNSSNGATLVTILNGGNFGIGTTSPSYKLQVSGAQNSNDIASTNTTTGASLRMQMIDVYGAVFTTASYPLMFGTNNTERVRIDTSGNVGIGTTSPSNLLHLKASTNPVMRLEGASDSAYVDYNGTRLQLSAGGGAMYFVTGNSEKVRIDSSGNVGIGTTSPVAKLDVRGTSYFQTSSNPTNSILALFTNQTTSSNNGARIALDAYNIGQIALGIPTDSASMAFYTGGAESARITPSGNVGIGTTSPSEKLHVQGNITVNANSYIKLTTDDRSYMRAAGTNNYDLYIQAHQNIRFGVNHLNVGENTSVLINPSGNVGIGTTNPSSFKLQVAGNVGPHADNTYDLGSSSLRWANIYTADLQLSNEGSCNDVDGTWGKWTIQEGENDLFLLNRRNNKKFRIKLEEV